MSVPETSSETRRFVWPSDYYCGPTPKPVLPRGVTFGCAAASVVVLILVFAGGAWLSRGGFFQLMDFAFAQSLGEVRGKYTSDVTPAQKAAFEQAMESLRENMRANKIAAAEIDPVLQSIRKAMKDKKVSRADVEAMTAAARKANRPRKP